MAAWLICALVGTFLISSSSPRSGGSGLGRIGWIDRTHNKARHCVRAFRTLRLFEAHAKSSRPWDGAGHPSVGSCANARALHNVRCHGKEAFAGALTRTCEPFIPFNYTDLCTNELVVADGGGHRRSSEVARRRVIADIFNPKLIIRADRRTAAVIDHHCEDDGFRDECWAQEKPLCTPSTNHVVPVNSGLYT